MSERRTRLIALLAILALAAALRLNAIDYTEFKRDEADAAYRTLRWAREGVFPATTLWTAGVNPPPFLEYLLYPAAVFTADPALLSAYVAIFNVVGVYLCYSMTSTFFGWRAGAISSLLFAVNPWAVLYSRKIWSSDFMPVFTVLFIHSVIMWGAMGKRAYLAPTLLLLPCLWSLHLTTILLGLLPVAVFLCLRPVADLRFGLIGLVLAAALFAPYVIYEYENGFEDLQGLVGRTKNVKSIIPGSMTQPLVMATTFGLRSSLGKDYAGFEAGAHRMPILDGAAVIAFVLGAVMLAMNSGREPAGLVLLLWLLVAAPMPYFSIAKGMEFQPPHYFLLFFPLQFIASGVFFDRLLARLWREGRRALAAVAVALLLSTVAYYAVFTLEFQEFTAGKKTIAGDYGMPLKHRVDAVREAVENNRTRALGDMSKDLANRYVMEYVLDAKEKIVVTGGKMPRGL